MFCANFSTYSPDLFEYLHPASTPRSIYNPSASKPSFNRMRHRDRLSFPPDTATSIRSSGSNMRCFLMKLNVIFSTHSTKCTSHRASLCWRILMTLSPAHMRQRCTPTWLLSARNNGNQLDLALISKSGFIIDQLAVSDSQNALGVKSQVCYQFPDGYVAGYLPFRISKDDFDHKRASNPVRVP